MRPGDDALVLVWSLFAVPGEFQVVHGSHLLLSGLLFVIAADEEGRAGEDLPAGGFPACLRRGAPQPLPQRPLWPSGGLPGWVSYRGTTYP